MKAIEFKHAVVISLLVLGFATHSSAVNLSQAAGLMAALESEAVQAKATLAKASLAGVDAVADPLAQSDEVDQAVSAGREALAAMEQAEVDGDIEAADAAGVKLAAALERARNARQGIFPETSTSVADADDDIEKDYTPPNIYDDPSESQGIRAYYESLFGVFDDASSFGQKGYRGSDQDATKT
jgi:hypothetical protein